MPGFIYSLLTLIISSNKLEFIQPQSGRFILNVALLLALGVTLSKYAADQMILSRMKPNQKVEVKPFFLNRVFPIIVLYVGFLFFSQKVFTSITLLICLPIEVFAIIATIEMNVSKRFLNALFINLIGYPLIFLLFMTFSYWISFNEYMILLIFVGCSILKFFLVLYTRNKTEIRNDILLLSARVPLQQAGNYLLFRLDQVFIALNIIPSLLFCFSLPMDYLFYSKFVDILSGIATSLSPVLISYSQINNSEINFSPIAKNKFYKLASVGAIILFIGVAFVLLKKMDVLHGLLIIPFSISALLIVPVNLINYEFYRKNELKKLNQINFLAFLPSIVLILGNLYFKSVLLFAFLIPIQLFSFLIINQLMLKRSEHR